MNYRDMILNETKMHYENDKDNLPKQSTYTYKSRNENGKKVVDVEVEGNTPLIKAYKKYVEKCKEQNKAPLSLKKWMATRGLAVAGSVAGAGALIATGTKHVKNRKERKKYTVIGRDGLPVKEGYDNIFMEEESKKVSTKEIYNQYVEDCKSKGKPYLSYGRWKATRKAIDRVNATTDMMMASNGAFNAYMEGYNDALNEMACCDEKVSRISKPNANNLNNRKPKKKIENHYMSFKEEDDDLYDYYDDAEDCFDDAYLEGYYDAIELLNEANGNRRIATGLIIDATGSTVAGISKKVRNHNSNKYFYLKKQLEKAKEEGNEEKVKEIMDKMKKAEKTIDTANKVGLAGSVASLAGTGTVISGVGRKIKDAKK